MNKGRKKGNVHFIPDLVIEEEKGKKG